MDSIKLSCSSNAYTDISLNEAIRRIAGIGYPGLEIIAGHEKFQEEGSCETIIQRLKETLGIYNVSVANISIPSAIVGTDGSVASFNALNGNIWAECQYIDQVKHYIRFAAKLKCKSVSLSPGVMLFNGSFEDRYQTLLNGVLEVSKFARSLGIIIGLSYGPGLLIKDAEEIKPLLIKCRGLKLSFHAGNSHLACETPCQIAADFKHQMSHIHIADVGSSERTYPVPGSGEIEWISFIRTLSWIGYHGFVTIDLRSYNDKPDWAAHRAFYYISSIIRGIMQPRHNKIA